MLKTMNEENSENKLIREEKILKINGYICCEWKAQVKSQLLAVHAYLLAFL